MASAEIIGIEVSPFVNSLVMGIIAASGFIIGSVAAIKIKYKTKTRGDFTAIAAGIFFGSIAFSLINEATELAHAGTMILGFISGAVAFSIIHRSIKKWPKYKGRPFKSEKDKGNDNNSNDSSKQGSASLNAIVGAILDSFPKTLFIGVIIAMQLHGLIGVVIALFLGNLTHTLSGAKLMVEKGISKSKIIKEWSVDFVIVASAGPIGYYVVRHLSEEHLSIIAGFAAGTLMIFVSRELIPQAYEENSGYMIDISLVSGFLISFLLFQYL